MPDTITLTGRVRPAPMFRPELRAAIRSGLKTQTRRVVKPDPKRVHQQYADGSILTARLFRRKDQTIQPPYGKPGDMWYLREPLRPSGARVVVYADDGQPVWLGGAETITWPWKRDRLSQMQMPRRAARTFMVVTDVTCERGENGWVWVYTFRLATPAEAEKASGR